MSYAYFGYINRPFVDISGVLHSWADISEKFIVYEHNEKDGSTHTHCHIFALGVQLDKKQLYKRKDFRALQLDGTKKEFGMNDYEPGRETLSYMTKGIYDPMMNKGFADQEIADAKAVGYSRKLQTSADADANAPDKRSSTKTSEPLKEWNQLRKDFHEAFADNRKPLLIDVRRWCMRWFYKKHGLMPHAPSYKRYSSTLYFEAVVNAEAKDPTCNCETTALDEILDWAY